MSTPATTVVAPPNTGVATFLVVLSAIGFGTVPIFAKGLSDAGMAPHVVAIYRYLLTAIALSPFLRFTRGRWRYSLAGIATGMFLGLGWTGYVNALHVAPVSTAGVLYMTYPLFTLAFGWLVFRETPGKRATLAALMILAAAMLAMSPAAVSPEQVPALLLSLAAPISFAAGIQVLTRYLVHLPPLSRIASVTLGSVIGLLPLVIASGDAGQLLPPVSQWWLVAGLALATALLPQLIYSVNAPRIGAARTAMAGSIELPTMFAVGWLAFSEAIGPAQLLAGAMVVAAIIVTPSRGVAAASVTPEP